MTRLIAIARRARVKTTPTLGPEVSNLWKSALTVPCVPASGVSVLQMVPLVPVWPRLRMVPVLVLVQASCPDELPKFKQYYNQHNSDGAKDSRGLQRRKAAALLGVQRAGLVVLRPLLDAQPRPPSTPPPDAGFQPLVQVLGDASQESSWRLSLHPPDPCGHRQDSKAPPPRPHGVMLPITEALFRV
jgi:hypothetical protein